jgi:hypothetical protein
MLFVASRWSVTIRHLAKIIVLPFIIFSFRPRNILPTQSKQFSVRKQEQKNGYTIMILNTYVAV